MAVKKKDNLITDEVSRVIGCQSRFAVINRDMTEALQELPDNCIDWCVCDPPYGLSKAKTKDIREAMRA